MNLTGIQYAYQPRLGTKCTKPDFEDCWLTEDFAISQAEFHSQACAQKKSSNLYPLVTLCR